MLEIGSEYLINTNMNKKQWLFNYMLDKGLTEAQAFTYLELNDKCNYEGMIRAWRKQAESEEKDYEMEEDYRKTYSPNEAIKDCYQTAKKMRALHNPDPIEVNLSMF